MTVAFKSPLTSANLNGKLISRTDNQTASGKIDFINGIEINGIELTKASGVLDVSDTGGIKIPDGTDGQRPSAGNGVFRYNLTSNKFEGYENGAWTNFIGAAGARSFRAATSTDSITTGDDTVSYSGASFTATLYTAVGNAGKRVTIIHAGTSLTEVYTLATTSAQTIGGIASGSYKLVTNGEVLTVESNGTNWSIVEHKTNTGLVGYTPTFTGFGTVSVENCYWCRVGSYIDFNATFTCGTTTGVEARVSLPATPISTLPTISNVGVLFKSAATVGSFSVLAEASTAYVTFGLQDAARPGLTKLLGNANFATGQVLSFFAKIPITDWQP